MTTCIGRVKGKNVYYRLFLQFTGFSNQFPKFQFQLLLFVLLTHCIELLDLADPWLYTKKQTKGPKKYLLFPSDYLPLLQTTYTRG